MAKFFLKKCPECGTVVQAKRQDAAGYCGRVCQQKMLIRLHLGRKQSQTQKDKRAASLRTFNKANPEKCAARVERAIKGNRTSEARAAALRRYENFAAAKIGICSDEQRAITASIGRWVLKKAQEALHAETDFDEVFTAVQDELRRDMPYDGLLGTSDYFDYLKKLGSRTASDRRVREIADAFMKHTIPRFHEERRKALEE